MSGGGRVANGKMLMNARDVEVANEGEGHEKGLGQKKHAHKVDMRRIFTLAF